MPYVCKTNRGQGSNLCMVLGSLMHKNNTIPRLQSLLNIDKKTLRAILKTLCENGLVYKHSQEKHELREDGTYKSGPLPVVFAFNNPPFSKEDFQR